MKNKRGRPMARFFWLTATFLGGAALAATPGVAAESLFAAGPARAERSAVRLLSAGPATEGVYRAGVEIDLLPATVTYWRQPGEAGAPPVFNFSRSVNAAKVEPVFPPPKHIEEAGSLVAGYDRRVLFALRVTPRDAKAPVRLEMTLDYAACGKICMPAQATLALDLPQSGVSPFAAEIAAVEKSAPKKIGAAEANKLFTLTRAAGSDKSWRLRAAGGARIVDVFPEAPEPLFLDVKPAGDDVFELTLDAPGGKAETPVAATLTIVTDAGAFEAPARLE
jgi:DsbC/DsbD-like thiol-disulfide interchange protein